MSKDTTAEHGEDFRYILRLSSSDVDGLKPIGMGLTSIKGVGMRTALAICKLAGLDSNKLGGNLSDDEVDSLSGIIEEYPTMIPYWMVNRQRDIETNEDQHLFAQEVTMTQNDDIDRLRASKSYRGVRHALGARVRGQRTRSNNRSGLTLGVERKN